MTATFPPAPGVAALLRSRAAARRAGRLYPAVYWLGGLVFVAGAIALVVSIANGSASAFAHSGIGFLWSGTWAPDAGDYGAGILVVGTLVTTGVAMLLTVPVGVGVAVALSELAPRRIAGPIGAAIEFLAAVPSIVVGLWALLVLSPVFQRDVEPFLGSLPGLHWLFGGSDDGPSILLASFVLAIMTLPTMVALSRSALAAVPRADREAAMALGATRWQVVRMAVLPAARSGLAAAGTLAIGRALGESIAVALIIGNGYSFPHSLVSTGSTIGSAIVNQFAEATPGVQTSSIIALGAVLLILTVAVNVGGQAVLRRGHRFDGPPPRGPAPGPARPDEPPLPAGGAGGGTARTTVQESARRSRGRRMITSRVAEALCAAAVVLAVAPLAALLWFTIRRGASAISASFLTHGPTPPGVPGGGIAPAITGTAEIVGLALLMAVPIGLATGLLLFERRGRVATAIRFVADVLTGVPSILIGIFAYTLLVETTHHFSTTAASFALAVLMVPIMVRANEEALRTVPADLWEAGVALGASRPSVARRVVLRQALPGVVTGNLLAIARGIGETAPLIFTVASQTAALPLVIFTQATQAYSSAQQTAWGAALVLLVVVFALSGVARTLAWYLTRRTR